MKRKRMGLTSLPPPREETLAETIEKKMPYRALTLGVGATGFVEVPLTGAVGVMVVTPRGSLEVTMRDGVVQVRGLRNTQGVDMLTVRPRASNLIEIDLGSL